MRVVFFAFDNTRGLCYNFVHWIEAFCAVVDERYQIDIFTLKGEQWPGLHLALKETAFPPTVKIKVFDDLQSVYADDGLKNADVIHCAGIRQARILAKMRKTEGLNFKIVMTVHAYRHSTRMAWIFKNMTSLLLARGISGWHFLSPGSFQDFVTRNFRRRAVANNSFVFPLGCKPGEFKSDAIVVPQTPADVLGFAPDGPTRHLMYFAQFRWGKGHSWMIEGIRDILRNHDVKLWLYGDGETRPRIKGLIAKLGLADKAVCPGRVPRKYVPYLLSKAYLGLCPTFNETFGHNFLEPMFSGIPVIGTPVGIGSWILQDYITGFRVNWGDGRRMAQRLRLCLEDGELVRRMGKNAKAMAERFFTWEDTARNCLSLYGELAGEQSKSRRVS